MDAGEAKAFLEKHHRGVLSTFRGDGSPQMSPVAAGIDGDGLVVISSRETAFKVKNLRRDPRASLCMFDDDFRAWVQVEGQASIMSLPEAMDGLVAYYRSLAGEHPDWDDYRAAMERDQRVLIRFKIERAGPNRFG